MSDEKNKQIAETNDIATSPQARSRWVLKGVIGILIFLVLLWVIYGVSSHMARPTIDVPQGAAPADGNLPSSLKE